MPRNRSFTICRTVTAHRSHRAVLAAALAAVAVTPADTRRRSRGRSPCRPVRHPDNDGGHTARTAHDAAPQGAADWAAASGHASGFVGAYTPTSKRLPRPNYAWTIRLVDNQTLVQVR